MAKYGRGLSVLADVAPDEIEVEVYVHCECGATYLFEMGDLLEVQVDGAVYCESCGSMVSVRSTLEMAWEV